MKTPIGTIIKCPVCGKMFVKDSNAKKYCSAQCRRKHNSRKPDNLEEFKCAWCGEEYQGTRRKRYCSAECRLEANARAKSRTRTRKKKKPVLSIEQVAVLSREAGMSYGEYVAKHLLYDKEE